MGGPRWTQRQKQTVFRLRAEGVYLKDIAHQLDRELSCVSLVVRLRPSFFGVSDPWTLERAGSASTSVSGSLRVWREASR
jgi:hypothetical protein